MKNSTTDERGTAVTEHAARANTWAREHFERTGYSILGQSVETRRGTLDLIAYDGKTIVFVDVSPAPDLHERKRRQIRRLAAAWLSDTRNRPTGRDVRFDTVRVLAGGHGLERLDHVEAAL